MLRQRIIPALLISNGKLVKTVRFNKPAYIGDPINAIKQFNEYGADELAVINIDRTPPDAAYIRRIADECTIPFSYGGGITSVEDVKNVLNNGAEKVIIRTHYGIIKECARTFGAQSIVLCIDHKNMFWGSVGKCLVYDNKWCTETPRQRIERVGQEHIGEILLQSVNCDGTMDGYDLDTIRDISAISKVPIVALGGAGCIEHLRQAKEAGADAVAAGSMFVYSRKGGGILISYPNREEVSI